MTFSRYVFDTSAWFTLLDEESGADTVAKILTNASQGLNQVLTSFATFMEIRYITLQKYDDIEAEKRVRLITHLPIMRVESTPRIGLYAAQIKSAYKLSFADAWIAALAQEKRAILVHKDPEFEQVEPFIPVLKLPYKTPTHPHL